MRLRSVKGADKYDFVRFTLTQRAKSPKSGEYKMKKFIIACVAVAAFAAPALAEGPTATFVFKDPHGPKLTSENHVGLLFRRRSPERSVCVWQLQSCGLDQTTAPGSRADAVQLLQAAEGRGRDK